MLDGLHLDRVSLIGMSFGGWLALSFAVAAPQRVHKLALLSPGGLLRWRKQWTLRAMGMVMFPSRLTVNGFMRWAGFTDRKGPADASLIFELIYLGLKHFRMPKETLRVRPRMLSDEELQALRMPVLLLIGEDEVMHDAATALARARKLIPNFDGDLVPNSRHDMCSRQSRIVDARVLDFLRKKMDSAA